MRVAVVEYAPTGFVAVVAVIDNANAFVDVLADGVRAGSNTRNTLVVAVDGAVAIIQKVSADVVNMLVISFSLVATAGTLIF